MARLELLVETPDKQTLRKSVPPKGLVLGRYPDNDIVVPDDITVSGRHMRFDYTDEGLLVQDLKSSNGTRVNRKNIGHLPYRLKAGDVVEAGHTKITVVETKEKKSRRGFGEVISGVRSKLSEVTGRLLKKSAAGKDKPAAPPGFALCPGCGAKIHIGVKARGSKVGCPRCKRTFPL